VTAVNVRALLSLTIVDHGDDTFIVGSPYGNDYIALPELGAQIIRWFQDGSTVEECTRRAEQIAGEPVDVQDLLDQLAAGGLLAADPDQLPPRVRFERLGRLLFNPVAWTVYSVATVVGLVLLITHPHLRPHSSDVIPFRTPLANLLILTLIALGLTGKHEAAHVLATSAQGLPSSLSISRRFYFVVFQADLTSLWSRPRRYRFGPLLAGMAWDLSLVGVLLVVEDRVQLPVTVLHLTRATIFLEIGGTLLQFWIFMRTDVYAVLVAAIRCTNLQAAKSALLHTMLRRSTAEDVTLLDALSARERRWAKLYLILYVPGVCYVTWYLVRYAGPGLVRTLRLVVHVLLTGTQLQRSGAAVALVAVLLPTMLTIAAAGRGSVRALRAILGHRRSDDLVAERT